MPPLPRCAQVIPFFKGMASSGKSTIVLKVAKQFFEGVDVGVLTALPRLRRLHVFGCGQLGCLALRAPAELAAAAPELAAQ